MKVDWAFAEPRVTFVWRVTASAALMLCGVALALISSRWVSSDREGAVEVAVRTPLVRELLSLNAATAAILASGAVTGGVTTIAGLVRLGFVLGHTGSVVTSSGLSTATVIAGVLPHGVIELPAFWIAGAAGLNGLTLLIRYSNAQPIGLCSLVISTCRELALSVGLLIVAAVVEVYVTRLFVNLSR